MGGGLPDQPGDRVDLGVSGRASGAQRRDLLLGPPGQPSQPAGDRDDVIVADGAAGREHQRGGQLRAEGAVLCGRRAQRRVRDKHGR